MKLFRSVLPVMGETAAIGWFILRDISFILLLPLIPAGLLFYFLHKGEMIRWLNALCAAAAAVITAMTVSAGVFDGRGMVMLLLLLILTGMMAVGLPEDELDRVAGWWMIGFIAIFAVVLIATIPGVRLRSGLPEIGGWIDIAVFYLLVFLEPLSLGKNYRAAPLVLGILLIPFGVVSYLALGQAAFDMAEFPYLSVWAGVAFSSFHHTEAITLCFYYGVGALRTAYCFINYKNTVKKY